jgi:hypothetical protein
VFIEEWRDLLVMRKIVFYVRSYPFDLLTRKVTLITYVYYTLIPFIFAINTTKLFCNRIIHASLGNCVFDKFLVPRLLLFKTRIPLVNPLYMDTLPKSPLKKRGEPLTISPSNPEVNMSTSLKIKKISEKLLNGTKLRSDQQEKVARQGNFT